MIDIEKLKDLIDEENYPYFDDLYLANKIADMELIEGMTIEIIAKGLCIKKASIEEIKLGDIIIPSPKNYFLMLANQLRANRTGTVVRADGR